MADFNSFEEMRPVLIRQISSGVKKALEKGMEIAYEYIIVNWYGKYPKENKHTYDRLKLMTESLKIKVEEKGDEIVGYLYIREDLHPASNSWNENPVTFSYLYEWFVSEYGEQDILEYTQEQLEMLQTFFNIIKSELSNAGFDFE